MFDKSNITRLILLICSLALIVQYAVFAQSKSRDEKKEPGLEAYLVIAKKNIFKPLGYSEEAKQQEFALKGILGSDALIEAIGKSESYYVSPGETFSSGAKLISIGKESAIITYNGNRIKLDLISSSGGADESKNAGKPASRRRGR